MKNIIINLILIFIVSINMSGQTLQPKVAFDYFPNSLGYTFMVNNELAELGRYRTRVGIDFIGNIPINKPFIKDIKYNVFTDIHTHMNFANRGLRFDPKIVNFYIGANLSYKKFKIEYKHLCVHPTKSHTSIPIQVYGGYDMISISYGY